MDRAEKAPVEDEAPSQSKDHVLEEKKEEELVRDECNNPTKKGFLTEATKKKHPPEEATQEEGLLPWTPRQGLGTGPTFKTDSAWSCTIP